MPEITKNQLKLIRSLSQKKVRQQTGLFVVEGKKNVTELLLANWEIAFIVKTAAYNEKINSPFITISEKQLKQVSNHKNPDGILAVAHQKAKTNTTTSHLILALDNINDPGNLGTIIRTADWFGISEVICSENTVDCYNPKVVQATKGSLFHINMKYQNLEEILTAFKGEVFGAALDGDIHQITPPTHPSILIMGSESHGISKNLEKYLTKKVLIPKKGKAESLNVGIATGILLSQLTS